MIGDFMKTEEIKTLKCDVSIVPINEPSCEHGGDQCTISATHRVSIDFRSAGISEFIGGEYCETCATEIAKRIQESLPDDE